MKIIQILNNNVLVAIENDEQFVLQGRGIGFNKNRGDYVDDDKIEKKFVSLDQSEDVLNLVTEFNHLDNVVIDLTMKYIKQVNNDYEVTLPIFLVQQISSMINNAQNDLYRHNPNWSDIRRLYPNEYSICLDLLKELNDYYKIDLKKDDAAFLALFIVNRYINTNSYEFEQVILHCKNIRDLLNKYYDFETTEYVYTRFVTHVNLCLQRVLRDEQITDEFNKGLYDYLISEYKEEFEILNKLCDYFKSNTKYELNEVEKQYFLIYLINSENFKK